MEAMLPENTCCFCRETFRGVGNCPFPVLEDGRACDTCNRSIVVAARIQAMRGKPDAASTLSQVPPAGARAAGAAGRPFPPDICGTHDA
eukprot:1921580-Prymnesium_polylepis.1